jgi:hypothetical protein
MKKLKLSVQRSTHANLLPVSGSKVFFCLFKNIKPAEKTLGCQVELESK